MVLHDVTCIFKRTGFTYDIISVRQSEFVGLTYDNISGRQSEGVGLGLAQLQP